MEPFVVCKNLEKTYGHTHALRALTIAIERGEILSVVGPSGCGKTTFLRLLAGFEQPDDGEIWLNGKQVNGTKIYVAPEKRGVGMVFQDLALFPHLTVYHNIVFGLHRLPRKEIKRRAEEMLKLVGLQGYDRRYPHQLSGGERQRVALARTLAPRPNLVLLDEPFSSLDAECRLQMRAEIRAILKNIGTTAVFVTHDQQEAINIGDRVAVFCAGRLCQVDTPTNLFSAPAERFVAEFMGQADFLPGRVTPAGIFTEIGILPQGSPLPNGTTIEIAMRADDVQIEPSPQAAARVIDCQFTGLVNIYRIQLDSGHVVHSLQPHTCHIPVGTTVQVRLEPGHHLAHFPLQHNTSHP